MTREALESGADVIYQGALLQFPWHGFSDFLLKVKGVPSLFGDYAYDVADTKLARTAKPKYVLQLCVYGDLLESVQGVAPPQLHVVLGDGSRTSIRTASVRHYYDVARRRFEAFTAATSLSSDAEPCGHCAFCRWKSYCEREWEATEHQSLVAGISRSQCDKLKSAGIVSMRALAMATGDRKVPDLQEEAFQRLRAQAGLQIARRDNGDKCVDVLPLQPGRGFQRLPQSDPGDLFFDMEGDPLFDGGLEYLFGILHVADDRSVFTDFWAHNREQEKKAFEEAVDFMMARLRERPGAHIYHYGAYEETALKRLAMYHGTRETAVDDFLRRGKLVDLYKVVREAIRVGEPRYSLKNLETFYLEDTRAGEVTTASDSIVMYERWRRLGDDRILIEIRDYNGLDRYSTLQCRDWLLRQRPSEAAWYLGPTVAGTNTGRDEKRTEAEARTSDMIAALLNCSPEDRHWRELLGFLLEFHRREAKPSWWAQFTRAEMSEEELIDDPECISALRSDGRPPRQYIHQIDEAVRYAILGNTGTLISFRLGAHDAPIIAQEFEPTFRPQDFLALSNFDVYLKLMIDGTPSQPFSATTLRSSLTAA